MTAKAKCAYYERVLSAGEKKTSFAVVNRLLSNQDKKLPDASSIEELCQTFASYFQKKITFIRDKIQYQRQQEGLLTMTDYHAAIPQFEHKLQQLEPVTQGELRKMVRQCTSKTCDLDPCPPDLLKKTLNAHISYLAAVVNDSFHRGIFPKMLKTALVRPLLKREDLNTSILANYRPVSNGPFIRKVLEKVAVNRILKHLTSNNLHEECDSAYRTLHSTETALLRVQHDIATTLDQNRAVILDMLDLSAAFDTIGRDSCSIYWRLTMEWPGQLSHGSGPIWKDVNSEYRLTLNVRPHPLAIWGTSEIGAWSSYIHPVYCSNATYYLASQEIERGHGGTTACVKELRHAVDSGSLAETQCWQNRDVNVCVKVPYEQIWAVHHQHWR